MGTELAFDDLGKGQVPLEFGDIVGAGDLAVTTTDAVVFVIPHDPGFRVFGEGRDRTGGDAGGIDTVHAEAPDERVTIDLPVFDLAGAIGVKFDDIDGFGGQIHRIVPEAVGIGSGPGANYCILCRPPCRPCSRYRAWRRKEYPWPRGGGVWAPGPRPAPD